MARKSRKEKSQEEIDREWIDTHGSLEWAGGVIVKTDDGYKFQIHNRVMTLPYKDSILNLKLAATKAAEEVTAISRWNRGTAMQAIGEQA